MKPAITFTAVGLTFGLLTIAAHANGPPAFESLLAQVSADPNCKPTDFNDFIVMTCDSGLTIWYFTKPNNPAYPGIIKRMAQQQPDGAWVSHEEGHSFAPDSAQPAFKAWFAQIEDLDRQAREELKRATGH
jgi:hypothetical protein